MNRRFTTAFVTLCMCLAFSSHVSRLQGQDNQSESEIQRGLDIAPVALDLAGKNRSLVGLGSYYVNGVSDCVGCQHGTERWMEAIYEYLKAIPCVEGGPGYTEPRC